MLPQAFRRQVSGGTEEGSFREGSRVHSLLVNVLGNNHPNEKQFNSVPFTSFRRKTPSANFPRTFRGYSAALPFLVDMSTSIYVCLRGKQRHSNGALPGMRRCQPPNIGICFVIRGFPKTPTSTLIVGRFSQQISPSVTFRAPCAGSPLPGARRGHRSP